MILGRLYNTIGITLGAAVSSAWISMQGGLPFVPAFLFDPRSAGGQLIALTATIVGVSVLSFIGWKYARKRRHLPRCMRMPPVPRMPSRSEKTSLYRTLQVGMLIFTLGIPTAALVHFNSRLGDAWVYVNRSDSSTIYNDAEQYNDVRWLREGQDLDRMLWLASRRCDIRVWWYGDRFYENPFAEAGQHGNCLNRRDYSAPCLEDIDQCRGVSLVHVWQPLATTLLSVVAFLFAAGFMAAVFWPPRKGSDAAKAS